MNNNPWVLSPFDCQQNEGQFLLLQPVNGLISGDQARPFFLKSSLPPNILAQIWQLSDINKDGKLDRLEFFIAMHLVRNCMRGMPPPPTLPESMKLLPPLNAMPTFPMQAHPSVPQLPVRPVSAYGGTLPANFGSMNSSLYLSNNASFSGQNPSTTVAAPAFIMGIKELGDWSIPQNLKLRFSQHFNQLDRDRIGMLTGIQARSVLGESQLPTNVLAQIWTMSDVNKDGCLSIEEFCVAMHLIEMVKSGFALPSTLPPELSLFCHRSKTASPLADLMVPPPQKNFLLKTFEDKRRDNLDRGQAELERRRQILREEEERRRAEIERKEREEEERRERERQELEKKREAERVIERLREMEREREQAAEEERLKAEREEARKRLDQDRIKELEKIRVRDLETQYQNELEKTMQFQQRHKTMTFQLQAMEERSQLLNIEITNAHSEIVGITSEIEKMRESRDQKMTRINELQSKSQTLAVQCERLSHENLQLQSECQKTFCKKQETENLRKQISKQTDLIKLAEDELSDAKERLINQKKLVGKKRPEFENGKQQLQKILQIYNKLVDKFCAIKNDAEKRIIFKRQKLAEKNLSNAEDPSKFYSLPPADANGNCSVLEQETFNPVISKSFDTDFTANFADVFPPSNSFGQNSTGIVSSHSVSSLSSVTNDISTNDFNNSQTTNSKTGNKESNVTVRYRALFEFVARSEDELSLQPGDIILVFEEHASEPGWLAGQIKEKVGWFPAAFAERIPIASSNDIKKQVSSLSSIAASPSAEPLESIKEELTTEKESVADFGSNFSDAKPTVAVVLATKTLTNDSSSFVDKTPVLTTNSALYDAPPITHDNETTLNKTDTSAFSAKFEKVIGVGTALYQWKARNDTEMSFSRNDVIEVLEQAEMRWRGRLKKKPEVQGWFPKSYLKLSASDNLENMPFSNSASAETISAKLQSPTTTTAASIAANVTSSVFTQPTKSAVTSATNGSGGNWYVALYQFDAVETTDLSLKPGDMILVTETMEDWWVGTCNGNCGIFPANYVQKASPLNANSGVENVGRAMAAYEAIASNQISLKVGDLVRIYNTSPGGWWEGEVEYDGVKRSGWFPGNYVQVISGSIAATAEACNQSKHIGGNALATALFDYEAQHADELSFKTGDAIEVVDRCDSQWWKGRKQGTETAAPLLFPSNFVKCSD